MVIMHNLMAMNANRQFGIAGKNRKKSTEKLSSGYKINKAADDAAGLAISEKMRKQIRGLDRGIENTQDGISLCQVADGALAEVNDLLHRITELSVKSANGTNSQSDRQNIQMEINQILSEIDRIGETTTFNEIPLFKGSGKVSDVYGPSILTHDFDMKDTKLDFDYKLLGQSVNTNPDQLNLKAVNSITGEQFSLAADYYAKSSIKLSYGSTTDKVVPLKEFRALDNPQYNGSPPTLTRKFQYKNSDGVELNLTQKLIIKDSPGSDKQDYGISYSFENKGSVDITELDIMVNIDTVYAGMDGNESYFVNKEQITSPRIYNGSNYSFSSSTRAIVGIPNSLSIGPKWTNSQGLPYVQNISFNPNSKPDSFAIGSWGSDGISNWDYYEGPDQKWEQEKIWDPAVSLLWHTSDLLKDGKTKTFSFNYGIIAKEQDPNMGDEYTGANVLLRKSYGVRPLWIQSGAEAWDGIYMGLEGMDSKVLGIDQLDVTTAKKSRNAIDMAGSALSYISSYRSMIGALQNRMEHTIDNENNILENTTAAESKIRDTDIANELVQNTTDNILIQTGQAILAQANQSMGGVLSLLQ